MSEKKQELALEDFEEVVGGARRARRIKNSNSKSTQRIGQQGDGNSVSGHLHGGDGISQSNNIKGNNVKIGSNVNIGSAGNGSTFNF